MSQKKLVSITIIIFLLSISTTLSYIFYYQYSTTPLISPLSKFISPLTQTLGISHSNSNKVVYGFLPFWNLKEEKNFRYQLLTHTAYFGVDFNPDGSIKKISDDGFAEPGWNKLNSSTANKIFRKTKSHRGKTILVLRAMTQGLIESIVNSPARRQNAINNTLKILQEKNFNGINIDFEYVGTPDTQTINNFSLFVKEISQQCKSLSPNCQVSIDVFADSASRKRIWDFAALTPHLDHVIIMAYDFFRASSTQAGPVAPLRGSCDQTQNQPDTCLDHDVAKTIAAFTKIIPSQKIILGVPYYGYQWQTASPDFLSATYQSSGSTATYKRVQEFLGNQRSFLPKDPVLGLQTNWNNTTLTPWISYTEKSGALQQIHYEDVRSLGLKYDLVNQANLGGIAIWALGYDGSRPELWDLLEEKFFD